MTNYENKGSVTVSNDVVATIANIAASKVEGVASLSNSGLYDMIGLRNQSKGVIVDISDNEVTVDISIAIEYDSDINVVAEQVQKDVKDSIESMVGLNVKEVNINVEDVNLKKAAK